MNRTIIPIACVLALKSAQMWNNGYVPVSYTHLTPTKPDPHLVNGMRAAFGLAAQQVLYVGDSGVDIETARNAGLAGCGVLWGFRTGDELCGAGASYLVRSPEDIRVLVLEDVYKRQPSGSSYAPAWTRRCRRTSPCPRRSPGT